MREPKQKFKICPNCGVNDSLKLIKVYTKFISNGEIWKGDRWQYNCAVCKEGFSSTESDTISMENLKPKA